MLEVKPKLSAGGGADGRVGVLTFTVEEASMPSLTSRKALSEGCFSYKKMEEKKEVH